MRLAKGLLWHVAVLPCCLYTAVGLKFIALPMPAENSPVLDVMSVAAQLQSRGHSVYVFADTAGTTFAKMAAARHSSNTTAEAMYYIHVQDTSSNSLDAILIERGAEIKKVLSGNKLAGLRLIAKLQSFVAASCQSILADEHAMEEMRAVGADAIMAFGVPSTGDSCGCMMSHALGGVPWIDVYGHPMIYAPFNVPQMGSGNTLADLKTWKGFFKNLPPYLVLRMMRVLPELMGDPWGQARKASGLPTLHSAFAPAAAVARLFGAKREACEPILQVFLNSWAVEYARPLKPNQVLVGPGSPRPAHPITPPEVAAFVDEAPAGVVLMATGTTPQARLVLSKTDIVELAEGFALLAPVRVLWAVKQKHLPEGVQLSDLPLADNTMVVPWVDYNDVLGHPAIKALVSHCGWHTVNEAAYHGVPVVGVPFQFEQAESVFKLVSRGMAVLMPNAPAGRGRSNVTFERQQVADTIQKVINDPGYAAAARATAHALQVYSKRRHPYARAADAIELALYTKYAQFRSEEREQHKAQQELQQVQQQDEL